MKYDLVWRSEELSDLSPDRQTIDGLATRAHSRILAGKGIIITLVTEDDKVVISSYAMIAGSPDEAYGDFLFQFPEQYPAGEPEMGIRVAYFKVPSGNVLTVGGDLWRELEDRNGIEDAVKLAAMNMLTGSQLKLLAGRELKEDG